MEANGKFLSFSTGHRPEILVMWIFVFMGTFSITLAVRGTRTCEPITIPMCRDIGYNLTYMPNSFNHDSQEEAGLEVHQFWPLVEIQCSPDLKFFLCSMYTPICVPTYPKPLPPCRSVCERAKAGCAPLMRQYGFAWPDRMPCEDLPVFGEDPGNLCMDFNTSESGTPKPTLPPFPTKKPLPATPKSCPCSCKAPFLVVPETHNYYNSVVTGGVENCAVPCNSAYNSADERSFATFWIALWSIFCFVSTLMTVLTFLIDTERFKYPERPIIFLSGCYLLVSTGFIISLLGGHENVACEGEYVRYKSTGPPLCTAVFLLIYFFGMASSLWWVILAFTWFLAAGLKWGSEAIASYSQYFHFAAWLIPSVKSIVVLFMHSVDGDPISGICYVGNQNLTNLRAFVLAPLFVYLILGCSFLLLGFVSLFRIRNVIKQGGRKTDKLEKLMIRIGVFSVLYTVPATIVVGCYFYEQQTREQWQRSHTCTCEGDAMVPKPDYSVYMLKYLMCLVVGITSGVWIWTGKTLETWRCFLDKLVGRFPAGSRAGKPIEHHKASPLAHV
ncbi:frizzled-5-like [Apostichopus japonicus]|uniref:frizzled-5-like n=1 Tax=Stichopus japonicus TaxID=307972 RepID=UPI003AB64CE3